MKAVWPETPEHDKADSVDVVLDAESGTDVDLGEARAIVQRNMYWSMGLSLFPVPFLDLITTTGCQVYMLYELTRYYGVAFDRERGKALVAALVGGLIASSGAAGLSEVFARRFYLLKLLTRPAFAAAVTYAIGMLFIEHLESGGTLLTLDPEAMRTRFKTLYQEGRAF